MSKFQRLLNILIGIVTVLIAILMQIEPSLGYVVMILFIGIGFGLTGARELIYFFRMARYMVDGKIVLYKAAIRLDICAFTLSVAGIPQQYAMLYLLVTYLFGAAVALLGAMEAKKLGADFWKRKLIYGVVLLAIAIAGLCSLSSIRMVMIIYGLGLVASAVERISQSFRRTTMVYVQ